MSAPRVAALALTLSCAATGCFIPNNVVHRPHGGDDVGTEAGVDVPGVDVSGPDVPGDVITGPAMVRFANLSTGAPSMDFCLRPAGAAGFTDQPVMRALGAASSPPEAGPNGLQFAQVGGRAGVPAGAYELRFVARGAANCSTPLADIADVVTLPAFGPGASYTVAVMGSPSLVGVGEFRVEVFPDDPTPAPAGRARLRFVNASGDSSMIDFGILDATDVFMPLATGVNFGSAGSPAYREVSATETQYATQIPGVGSYSVRAANTALPDGAATTAFLIGGVTSDQRPAELIFCSDTQVIGAYAICERRPKRQFLRFANLFPDLPATLDVCVSVDGGPLQGPLLRIRSISRGLQFTEVSGYLTQPAGMLTIHAVPGGSGASCSGTFPAMLSIPDVTVVGSPDTHTTVVGMGDGTPMEDPSPRLFAFTDTHDEPLPGFVGLRIIHASPGTPNLDIGALTPAFEPNWTNVAFSEVGVPAMSDANGYARLPPFPMLPVRFQHSVTGAMPFDVESSSASGDVISAFVVGVEGVAPPDPRHYSALICYDRVDAVRGLAVCERLQRITP